MHPQCTDLPTTTLPNPLQCPSVMTVSIISVMKKVSHRIEWHNAERETKERQRGGGGVRSLLTDHSWKPEEGARPGDSAESECSEQFCKQTPTQATLKDEREKVNWLAACMKELELVCVQTLNIIHVCCVQCCFCLLSLSVSKCISLYCTYIYCTVCLHAPLRCLQIYWPTSFCLPSPTPLHSKTRLTSYDKGENVIQKVKGVASMKELKLVNTHKHTHTLLLSLPTSVLFCDNSENHVSEEERLSQGLSDIKQ